MDQLTDDEKALLDFEGGAWWKYAGAKETAVREQFGISATRYYQRLNVLIDRPEANAAGAGETAITIVAAAVGNAIFDATGVRIREVPFTPERMRAALA